MLLTPRKLGLRPRFPFYHQPSSDHQPSPGARPYDSVCDLAPSLHNLPFLLKPFPPVSPRHRNGYIDWLAYFDCLHL